MSNNNVSDAQIEAVILRHLREYAGKSARNGDLLVAVQGALGSYKIQLRRVQRIAGEMCNRGLLTVEERGAWVTYYPPRGPDKKYGCSLWISTVAFYSIPPETI